MSGYDAGQLFSRESSTSRDNETPSSSFSALEVHELSKLHLHLSRAINNGKLPPQKLKVAEEALLKLQARLKPVNALFIEAPRDPELHRFTIDIFHSLRELYLNRCPPSTVLGIYKLRFQLVRLEVINSGIDCLFDFLGPDVWDRSFSCPPMLLPGDVVPVDDEYKWHQVTNLRLSNCGIDRLDKSMHLFPSLEQLDLSFNDIAHVIHLQDSTQLSVLNISNNRISVLSNLSRVVPNITKLNLSNNRIESLDGLEFLEFLTKLDVSNNLLDDFQEISHLAELKELESVILEGNLLSLRANYRLHVFTKFLDGTIVTGRELPRLDGTPVTELEAYAMRGIMFRPSYSVNGASTGANSVSEYPRSPSRLVSVSARTPPTSLLADLVLSTPPRDYSPMPHSRERDSFSGSSGYESRGGNYRNLSVVELDKRFNAALSVWTAALTTEDGMLSPKLSSMLSPSQVFEANHNRGPQFFAAKPASSKRHMRSDNDGHHIRERIEQMKSDSFDERDREAENESSLSPSAPVRAIPGTPPSALSSSSYTARRPPALKHAGVLGTPASSPGNTPRGNGSRNVSFALPAEASALSPNQSQRVVSELSEKELLHLISLNHRSSHNALCPVRRRKRAKVAHVADEVLSRLPSLLSEYRVQVEQKAFVPKDAPSRYRSPKLELRGDLSPTAKAAPQSASAPNSPYAATEAEWELDKGERERRKSEIREKLKRIQSGLDSITADGSEASISDSNRPKRDVLDGAISIDDSDCAFNETVVETPMPPSQEEDCATKSSNVDLGDKGAGIEDANQGGLVAAEKIPVVDEEVCSDEQTGDAERTDCSGDNEPIGCSTGSTTPTKIAGKTPLVPKMTPSPVRPSMSMLSWEDDEEENLYETADMSQENVLQESVTVEDEAETAAETADAAMDDEGAVASGSDLPGPLETAGTEFTVRESQAEELLLEELESDDKVGSDLDATVLAATGAAGLIHKTRSSSVDRKASASTTSTSSDPSVLSGGMMAGGMPSMSVEASRQSMDMDASGVEQIRPPYVGNTDYVEFGVIENLELYMREQVFSQNRPSFPAPYIMSEESRGDIRYVAPPPYTERFVAVYREKVYMSSHTSENKDDGYTSLRELSSEAASAHATAAAKETAVPKAAVSTPYILLVATDLFLYILKDFPRINRSTKAPFLFRDSPIPVLIRVHPLQCLRVCTIFFNFQRCALNFSSSPGTFSLPPDLDNGYTYVIITREKSKTYPIITTLPPLANSVRAVADNSSRKVLIENTDAQLLDGITEILRGLKSTLFDVVHYQMVFQYKKKQPNVLYPRSLVISQELILLCDEDLTSVEARVSLVDSNRLKNIFHVRSEENPLHLTILFKSKAFVGPGQKWRLIFETRSAATRTREDCNRACAEIGNILK